MKNAGPIVRRVSIVMLAALAALAASTAGGGCGGVLRSVGADGGDGAGDGSNGGTDGGASSGGASSSGTGSGSGSSSSSSGGESSSGYGPLIELSSSPCPSGTSTTISGHVYDPANVNPVYGATVYVPHTALKALPVGAVCGCSVLYPQLYSVALTDSSGFFKITGAPTSGPNGGAVPLVVQLGKWRMQTTLKINACQDNPIPDHSLRLPKNHLEGDLPHIAVSTGAADSLECLFTRIGLDSSEYVAGAGSPGGGHVHIFTGAGGVGGAALQGGVAYDPSQSLWDKKSDMASYDAVLFSCEGTETAHVNAVGQQAILDYANNGGRIFASHFHYALLNTGPFAAAARQPLATWTTGAATDKDPISAAPVMLLPFPGAKAFPEGVAFDQWLGNVGALTSGKLLVHHAADNAALDAGNGLSQPWLTADTSSRVPGSAQYFSVDTPLFGLGDSSCSGRVVYSDLHVGGGPNDTSDPNTDYPGFSPGIVPSGCTQHPLTAQEKALEFMIFDLTSTCLTPIGQPSPPIPTPM